MNRVLSLLTVFMIGFLAFAFSLDASAYSCASGATVGARVTITVLNSVAPCAVGQLVLYSPAENLAISAAVAATAQNTGTVFDPVMAGAVWMFSITTVLGVWVLAKNAGIIIDMVKRW